LDGLTELPRLLSVNLKSCHRLTELAPLATLPRLNFLYFFMHPTLNQDHLAALKGHPKLVELHLTCSKALTSVEWLADMPRLIKVDLNNTPIESFDGVKNLPKLREINFEWCTTLTCIDALADCTQLQKLFIQRTQINNVEALMNLPDLKVVDVSYSRKIPDEQLKRLKAIKGLSVRKDEPLQPYTKEWYAQKKAEEESAPPVRHEIRGLHGGRTRSHVFCERSVESDTQIIGLPELVEVEIGGRTLVALSESWTWEGWFARSLVFLTADIADHTDPELREVALNFFHVPFLPAAITNNKGDRGKGFGSSTVTRREQFTFVNVLKGESREQWW
jgi:hypothetical protein